VKLAIIPMSKLFGGHILSVGTNLMLENDKITEDKLRKVQTKEKQGGVKKEGFFFLYFMLRNY
jgi:hypothetical protein